MSKKFWIVSLSVIAISLLLVNAGVVFSQNFNPAITLQEPVPEAQVRFGEGLATGDVNGDGKVDVVVGTLESTVSSLSTAGEIHVFLGPDFVNSKTITEDTPEANAAFGSDVAIGDVNGDNFDDIIVGASQGTVGSKSFAGEVFVYFGNANLANIGNPPSVTLQRATPLLGDRFGSDVATGDVDNDGFDDIVSGGFTATPDVGTRTTKSGAVWVFSGSATLSGTITTNSATELINPTQENAAAFSNEIATGDLNGDNFDDVIVADFGGTVSSVTRAGEVFVYLGSGSGISATHSATLQEATPEDTARFGIILATGNVDGDSADELVISAAVADVGATTDAGEVFVFESTPSGLTTTSSATKLTNPQPNTNGGFGVGLAIGDLDNDGFGDVIVGHKSADPDPGTGSIADAGEVNIYLGSPTGVSSTSAKSVLSPNPTVGFRFGAGLEAVDVDNDGNDDLFVGSGSVNIGAVGKAGQLFLFVSDNVTPAAPVITSPAAASTVSSATISGTSEASASIEVFEGATSLGTTTALGTDWTLTPTLADGSHTVTAKATDAAGNVSPASTSVTFTLETPLSVITYFVKQATGSDTTCDLSRENDATKPFLTIQGTFDCLKSNHSDLTGVGRFRIEVLDSATYLEEVNLSGLTTTTRETLTITAAAGEMPTIDGQNTRGTGFDVRIDNVIIDGFFLKNFQGSNSDQFGNAIQIDGNSNLEVRNCIIDAQADFAILIGYRHAGAVDDPSNNVFIHNNVLMNSKHEGSTTQNSGDLIHIMGGPDGTRIINNVFYAFESDAIFFMQVSPTDVALNTVIKNNIFYPTTGGSSGITVTDSEAELETTSDFNVFFLTGGVSARAGFWGGMFQQSLIDWRSASGQDSNSIDTDPLFRILGSDFHLQSTHGVFNGVDFSELSASDSPAIDTGDPSSTFENEKVPNGGRINIGAYGNTPEASLSPDEPPVLTVPPDKTVEATGPSGQSVDIGIATATDNIDPSPTITNDAPALFNLGTTNVTWTATDSLGNSASKVQLVTVVDTTAPIITTPGAVTVEATSAAGAVVTYTAPTATDDVGVTVGPSCIPASDTTFGITTTTVTCTASDAAGNTGTKSFTVTVEDTTQPAITTPTNIIAEATGPTGAVVTYSGESATDIVDGVVLVSCTPASSSTFGITTTTVTCTASDAAGNTGTKSFTVTVQDTTAPVVTTSSNIIAEATGPTGAIVTYTAPTATDAVGVTVGPSCTPASSSTFAITTTTVTCTASDAAGNTGTKSFTVTVQDTTAPVVTTSNDVTAEPTGPTGAVVIYTAPTATDDVGVTVGPTCTPASSSTFAITSTIVTCTASDAAGNTGSARFAVTVQDVTAPIITTSSNIIAEATGPTGAVVTYTAPTATDDVGVTVGPTCTPASSSTFAITTTTVTCTASDAAGNTGTKSFTVTVEDTTAPVVTTSSNIIAEATGPTGAVVTYTAPTATDDVGVTVGPSCTPASSSTFAITTTTVTCTASDAAGNTGTKSFTVTVQDTTAPVVTTSSNIIAEATGPTGAVVTYTAPTATDDVGVTVGPTCTPASSSTFGITTTTVTCTASDAAGNTGTKSFTVTVQDTTPPVVTTSVDVTADATSSTGAIVTYTAPTATDDVGVTVGPTCTPASSSTFAITTTTVTCTASDAAGNTGTKSFTVTVGNTPTGINVEVSPDPNVTVTFSEVTVKGATFVTVSTTDPGPGVTAFRFLDKFYDITTTATLTGNVEVCIDYDDTGLSKGREKNLKIFHLEGGVYVKVTSSLDTEINRICGTVSSLSVFAVAFDSGAPETTITSGPSSPSTSTDATFTFEASDNVNAASTLYIECSLDGTMFTSCTSPESFSGLTEGSHTFQVRATDESGNTDATPASFTWIVGTTLVADKNTVFLHTVNLAGGKGSTKVLLTDVEVRVFDRNDPNFQLTYGTKNPSGTIYNDVFENDIGRIATCTTDGTGMCTAFETAAGDYLVIVKFVDTPGTGKTVYTGLPKSPQDFLDTNGDGIGDLASKEFQIIKKIKKNGDVSFGGGKKVVVTGSILEVVYQDVAIWEPGVTSYIYPYIFTSDSAWTTDMCMYLPAGYAIVGIYDEFGNLVTTANCVQTFVSGETKVAAFEVIDIGSPKEFTVVVDLDAKTKGKPTTVTLSTDTKNDNANGLKAKDKLQDKGQDKKQDKKGS